MAPVLIKEMGDHSDYSFTGKKVVRKGNRIPSAAEKRVFFH